MLELSDFSSISQEHRFRIRTRLTPTFQCRLKFFFFFFVSLPSLLKTIISCTAANLSSCPPAADYEGLRDATDSFLAQHKSVMDADGLSQFLKVWELGRAS
jgi:hypothetical protein